tara:strand:+ start:1152 stop:1853 length:702 start_codon:yes stop_codon:yes gene_type:complete
MKNKEGKGPQIWLAGDPDDLKSWLKYGTAGIVTNTVVQKEMTEKHGTLIELTKKYLDITDKQVVIEIDGHSTQELLDIGEIFTKMSDQIILKIPCTIHGLGAFEILAKEDVETFCTTVFSLTQAVAVAQAGADHILPFCEPFKELGVDPGKLVKECADTFKKWDNGPKITAALVRSVDVAYSAIKNGADGIIIFWPVYKELMENPLTDKWNKLFLDQWNDMFDAGNLKGLPIK